MGILQLPLRRHLRPHIHVRFRRPGRLVPQLSTGSRRQGKRPAVLFPQVYDRQQLALCGLHAVQWAAERLGAGTESGIHADARYAGRREHMPADVSRFRGDGFGEGECHVERREGDAGGLYSDGRHVRCVRVESWNHQQYHSSRTGYYSFLVDHLRMMLVLPVVSRSSLLS